MAFRQGVDTLISVARSGRLRFRPHLLCVLFLTLILCLPSPGWCAWPDSVLVIGQSAEPKSLDPHVTTSLNDFRILVNVYEGLVRFRAGTLDLEPALAEAWEIGDDGRSYTFYLRDGVTFHDGTPFDAEAVRYNFQRLLDANHPDHHTGPFPLAFFFDSVARVETLKPDTVRFILKRPFAPFLANLAYPTGLLVSPTAVRRHGVAYGRHPAGTGPFRVVDWTSKQRIVLTPNRAYRGRPPCLETVIFRPVVDPMTRVAELLAGGLDLAFGIGPDNVALLRNHPGFQVHEAVGPHLWFLILNTRHGPLRDVRVRQAVNYAIHKEALIHQVLQDTATVATGPVPTAFSWAVDSDLKPYPYDPKRAKALLIEAGYPEGLKLALLAPQGGSGMLAPLQMAAAIQGDLAKVGIQMTIESYEWNAYLAKVNAGLGAGVDMAEMAWMTNDPDTLFHLTLRSGATADNGGFNSGWYTNPEVDRLIAKARTTTERDRRADYYRPLQRLVHADAPWAFIASWRQNLVARTHIHGLRLQPSFFLLLPTIRKGDSACQTQVSCGKEASEGC